MAGAWTRLIAWLRRLPRQSGEADEPKLGYTDPVKPVPEPPPVPDELMPMTRDSKRKRAIIDACVATFETGDPYGGYDASAMLDDHAGISHGKHQMTDGGGKLDMAMYRYIDRGGLYAAKFAPYMARMDKNATAQYNSRDYPEWVGDLMALLSKAGCDDPMWRTIQDEVFNEEYWSPAATAAEDMGLVLPISWLLLYDTCIQSGPWLISSLRPKFSAMPPSRGGNEKEWTQAFAEAREHWMANFVGKSDGHTNAVRHSRSRVHRMLGLMNDGNWRLKTPFQLVDPDGNYDVTIGQPTNT